MTPAPCAFAASTSNPSKETTRTAGSPIGTDAATSASRSSGVNRVFFAAFDPTATTSASNSAAPRAMTSTWPLVGGSNVPA
jgi:hypothetical protein